MYEAAIEADNTDSTTKFAELVYGIETGEAERIAVDGVSRGTDDDSAGKLFLAPSSWGKNLILDSGFKLDYAAKCNQDASRENCGLTSIRHDHHQ